MIRFFYILSFALCVIALEKVEAAGKKSAATSDQDPVIEMLAKSRVEAEGGEASLPTLVGEAKLVAKADAAALEAAAVMGKSPKVGRKSAKAQEAVRNQETNAPEPTEKEIPLSQKVDPELGFANTLTANGEETFGEAERAASESDSAKSEVVGEDKTENSDAAVTAAAKSVSEISKLNEKEIPVLTNEKKESKNSGSLVQRAVISVGVLLVLLIGATWGLKGWTSRSTKGKNNQKIKILTQHFIGPKKSIAIIQVAGESILIGVTDHSINLLKTLSLLDEEVPEEVPNHFNLSLAGSNFAEGETEREAPKSKDRNGRFLTGSLGREADDFAMRGLAEIRDTVSRRLKGMKEF